MLFTYASKGRRELPNSTVLVDGPTERLGNRSVRRPTHLHATSWRRRADQRVQFPGLGHAREAGPGIPGRRADRGQTGVPGVVPGRGRRREIIDSGLLPEGSLQLVAGGSRGLLDLLTEQDTVAFTGSASTAALLKSHRSVL